MLDNDKIKPFIYSHKYLEHKSLKTPRSWLWSNSGWINGLFSVSYEILKWMVFITTTITKYHNYLFQFGVSVDIDKILTQHINLGFTN